MKDISLYIVNVPVRTLVFLKISYLGLVPSTIPVSMQHSLRVKTSVLTFAAYFQFV